MKILQLALRDLWERPFSCILSILGIALAVATFISVESLLTSFERAVSENISATEIQMEVTEGGAVDFLSSIVPEQLASEVGAVPGIQAASPMLVRLVPLQGVSTPTLGWPDASYLWDSLTMEQGRRPKAAQPIEIVAGAQIAQRLNLAVGSTLNLLGTEAVIVGVANTQSHINRSALFARLPDLQEATFRKGQATAIAIRLTPDAMPDMPRMKKEIAAKVGSYAVLDTAELTRDNSLLRLVRALSTSLSVVAALLGLFGVLNTAWSLVRQRRHEFAILQAVGWPPRRIALFVFCEAACVGFSGWIIGVVVGFGGAKIVSLLPMVSGSLNLQLQGSLLLASGLACLVISAIGTLLPVWSILREEPASVLRAP